MSEEVPHRIQKKTLGGLLGVYDESKKELYAAQIEQRDENLRRYPHRCYFDYHSVQVQTDTHRRCGMCVEHCRCTGRFGNWKGRGGRYKNERVEDA